MFFYDTATVKNIPLTNVPEWVGNILLFSKQKNLPSNISYIKCKS